MQLSYYKLEIVSTSLRVIIFLGLSDGTVLRINKREFKLSIVSKVNIVSRLGKWTLRAGCSITNQETQ